MTREQALMRASYLRTLHRFVGPLMGWRVVTPSNDLQRAAPLSRRAHGASSDPEAKPHLIPAGGA